MNGMLTIHLFPSKKTACVLCILYLWILAGLVVTATAEQCEYIKVVLSLYLTEELLKKLHFLSCYTGMVSILPQEGCVLFQEKKQYLRPDYLPLISAAGIWIFLYAQREKGSEVRQCWIAQDALSPTHWRQLCWAILFYIQWNQKL